MYIYSSDLGDWVNCGVCGEWAHLGCDRRQRARQFQGRRLLILKHPFCFPLRNSKKIRLQIDVAAVATGLLKDVAPV